MDVDTPSASSSRNPRSRFQSAVRAVQTANHLKAFPRTNICGFEVRKYLEEVRNSHCNKLRPPERNKLVSHAQNAILDAGYSMGSSEKMTALLLYLVHEDFARCGRTDEAAENEFLRSDGGSYMKDYIVSLPEENEDDKPGHDQDRLKVVERFLDEMTNEEILEDDTSILVVQKKEAAAGTVVNDMREDRSLPLLLIWFYSALRWIAEMFSRSVPEETR